MRAGTLVSALTMSCNDCGIQGGLTKRSESEAEASADAEGVAAPPVESGRPFPGSAEPAVLLQTSWWRSETASPLGTLFYYLPVPLVLQFPGGQYAHPRGQVRGRLGGHEK